MYTTHSKQLPHSEPWTAIENALGPDAPEVLRELRSTMRDRVSGLCTGYLYLAGPYSHADAAVQISRELALTEAAALIADVVPVYSPISHGCAIATHLTGPQRPHSWWMAQCLPMLANAHAVIVLDLPGRQQSVGTLMEIEAAERMRKAVVFFTPTGQWAHSQPIPLTMPGAPAHTPLDQPLDQPT
jgi:hypothetical protein